MDQKNASPDYAGDQPQDAGPEQDEKTKKRRNRPIHFNESRAEQGGGELAGSRRPVA